MINVQENFKIDLRTYGRQFNIKLKVNNSDFNADNLNYIKPSFTTPLFKTIMHQIELDSKVFMSKGTKISGRIGVKVNEKNYKYIDLNNYYVQSCERQEDTNSYRILAYSKMKEAMVDYDLSFEGKTTVRNYLIKICERLGWNTDNIPATFINSGKMIDPNLHTGIKYSFRDALDEIATITCSFLMFKGDNFYLLYLTETNETIDESYLDEDNVTIGEKYFINSLVFSRAEESDNIYRKDNTSITANGLHEYRIADCQLLSTNDRADYIDEMFNYLKTLEFYIFDVQSKGILFLEACDLFNFKLNNTTYKVALLNDEINIDDGLTENLFLEKPEETETEYKYADSTDKKINQTYILVDKQNQRITQLTEETTENSQKITKTEQDVNGLTTKVSSVEKSVENITNTQNTATGKNIHLEDSSDDPLVSIKVKGSTSQATRSGKNLLDNTAITKISNGITFTVNSDGTVLADGTNDTTANSSLIINRYELSPGTYVLNGCPSGGAINTYRLAIQETGSYSVLGSIDIGNGSGEFTIDTTTIVQIAIFIQKGLTINKLLFKPMLRKATIADDTYEQYGASPSPDYPAKIENVEGKNKVKEINWKQMPSISTGATVTNVNGYGTDYINVDNTKQYIFSYLGTSGPHYIVYYDKDKNFLGYDTKIQINNFTKWSETGYVRLRVDCSQDSVTAFQLEEGTVATDYVPYNSLEIKDIGENLFDCANSKIIYNNAITLYERLTNGLKIISSGGQYNMLYFLVDTVENLKGKTLTLSSDILFSKEKQYVDFGLYYTDFNGGNRKSFGIIKSIKTEGYYTIKGIVEEGENRDYVCIGLRPNMDSNFAKGDYTIYDNLQVEIGETATPYKPCQEQKIDFPLSEGQKLYKDSYLASNKIHHKRKQIVFDGSNDEDWTPYSTKNGLAYKIPILNIKQIISTAIIADLYCDYYTKTSQNKIYDEKIDYGICQRANQSQIIIRNKDILTLAEWKAWLSEHPITVEYELSEEEIIPYTEEQQEAWDKIEELHTYKNVTNIFSTTELDITYVRDNGLSDMYETKQNASKNYEKTREKLVEQKTTVDGIVTNISDITSKTNTLTGELEETNEKIAEMNASIEGLGIKLQNKSGNNLLYYDKEYWKGANVIKTITRNIQLGDDLSGKKLVLSFPEGVSLGEELIADIIVGTSGYSISAQQMTDTSTGNFTDRITVNENGLQSIIYKYDKTNSEIINNFTEYTLANGFGKVTKIDTNINAYNYIKIEESYTEQVLNIEEYRNTEFVNNSTSGFGYIVNKGSSKQSIEVQNGTYTISFKYKKIASELANTSVKINGKEYSLTGTDWTTFKQIVEISANYIEVEFISDTNNALYVADLLANVGAEPDVWTQNPNETRTDTVTIGKGIKVKSSTTNTELKADSDGIRIDNTQTNKTVAEFTDKGTETEELVVRGQAQISGILIQQVDNQTWFSSLL